MERQRQSIGKRTALCAIIAFCTVLASLLSALDSRGQARSSSTQEAWFSAAHCHGSTAKTEWKLTDAHAPTPGCMVGKNVTKGVLDFDANEDESAILRLTVPQKFTGTVTVKIVWEPASPIGSVGWCVELLSSADVDGDRVIPVKQTAPQCASEEAKTVAHHLEKALAINVIATAPTADNGILHLRVSRDANSSVVLDDMPGDARLIGVAVETQELPRQNR